MSLKPLINVVCAIIEEKGKILALRRKRGENMAGKWEFPGGKINDNEIPESSIIREIKEELNLTIHPANQLLPVNFEYPDFIIHLIPFRCLILEGDIILSVHDRIQWLEPKDYFTLNWCEADRILINRLSEMKF